MEQVNGILAAVGRLPQDMAVLARATEISTASGLPLTVAHVLDLAGIGDTSSQMEGLIQQADTAAHDRIRAALTELGSDASAVEIRIENGTPALCLIALCESLRPALVVTRVHQDDSFLGKFVGSTTERLISAAVAPVLVVKRPVAGPYRRAILASDDRDDTRATLTFMSRMLPDAAIRLVQAVRIPPPLEEAMLRVGTDQATLAAHLSILTTGARERLRQISDSCEKRPAIQVLKGDPAAALVRRTRGAKTDLVVLGPGRAGLVRRAFMGSVTRRVLRDASCDVLVYHAGTPADQSASTAVAIEK